MNSPWAIVDSDTARAGAADSTSELHGLASRGAGDSGSNPLRAGSGGTPLPTVGAIPTPGATRPLFATPSLAEAHALRLASRASSTLRASYVPFTRLLRAEDGSGPAYEVRSANGGRSDDYEVAEVTELELLARVRAGMLRRADELDERAEAAEDEFSELRRTGKMRARAERLRVEAEECRTGAVQLRIRATGMTVVAATLAEDEELRRAV